MGAGCSGSWDSRGEEVRFVGADERAASDVKSMSAAALKLEHNGSAVRCLVTRNLDCGRTQGCASASPCASNWKRWSADRMEKPWKLGRPLQIKYRTNKIPNCIPAVERLRPTAFCARSIGHFLICFNVHLQSIVATSCRPPCRPTVCAPISPSQWLAPCLRLSL